MESRWSLQLPADQWFLKFLQPLGYFQYDQTIYGHCCGAGYMAIQAMQTDKGKAFNERLCLLYEIYEKAIYACLPVDERKTSHFIFLNKKPDLSYKDHLEGIQNFNYYAVNIEEYKKAHPNIFSSIEFKNKINELVNALNPTKRYSLLAWFDSVFGYQNTIDLPLDKTSPTQNRLPIFDNTSFSQLPLEEATYLSGFYKDKNEFQHTLQSIEEELNKKKISAPVSFLLRNINHVVSFTCDPKTNKWQYYDSNYPGIKDLTIAEIAEAINKYLAKGKSMASTMQIFSRSEINEIKGVIENIKETYPFDYKNDKTRLEFDSIGGSLFYTAIASGDVDTVKNILNEKNVDQKLLDQIVNNFNKVAYNKLSPLLLALYFDHQLGKNNDEIIQLLIKRYPQYIDVPAEDGKTTPLIKAIERNNEQLVIDLIKMGAIVTETALHRAIEKGHVKITRHLLEKNSEIKNLDLAFMNAARYGRLEMIKFLLEEKNVNLLNSVDEYNQNALIWATAGGHLALMKYLHEEKGLDLNSFTKLQNDKYKQHGYTALDWAIKNGHSHIVEYLLEHNAKSKNICEMFVLAVKAEKFEVVKILLEKNPELKLFSTVNKEDQPVLSWLASQGSYEMLKLIHESGGDLNHKSQFQEEEMQKFNGYTPLDWAIKNNKDIRVIRYLLQNEAESKNINDILMHKTQEKDLKTIEILCSKYKFTDDTFKDAVEEAINSNAFDLAHYFFEKLSFWTDKSHDSKSRIVNLLLIPLLDYIVTIKKESEYNGIPFFVDSRSQKLEAAKALRDAIFDPTQNVNKYEKLFTRGKRLKSIYETYKILILEDKELIVSSFNKI